MKKKMTLLGVVLCLTMATSAVGENERLVMTQVQDGENTRVVFAVQSEEALPEDAVLTAKIAETFKLNQTVRGHMTQQGMLWQDEKTASMALLWQGRQADGRDGSSTYTLTVDLETGEEIPLEALFADSEGAFETMEQIVEEDVLSGMNDYMEYQDLLPMPTDCYAVDETGLTVFWPEERYHYFDGQSGSVTFRWYELAEFVGEDSPVYAISRPEETDVEAIHAACEQGMLTDEIQLRLDSLLGEVAYKLADPDYTTDALVYPLERVRGYAVEIPKYADTEEDETPISAIRASRIHLHGLTTGRTTEEEIRAMLGEPAYTVSMSEDKAADALLEAGTSWYYSIQGAVLQLHLDEDGVLAVVILRRTMPESLL